jgi:RHS repeat-associated protein
MPNHHHGQSNILYDKNVTGGTTTITKHFYADGLQVAKMVGTGVYYLHEDALGSTMLTVTSTLTVKFSSNYVPYGPNYAISGKEVFMYTGKPYDAATGLYYFAARFYDPSLGRFITEDSYNGTKTDPLSMNRYSYAVENPIKYVDPTGHCIPKYGCGPPPPPQLPPGEVAAYAYATALSLFATGLTLALAFGQVEGLFALATTVELYFAQLPVLSAFPLLGEVIPEIAGQIVLAVPIFIGVLLIMSYLAYQYVTNAGQGANLQSAVGSSIEPFLEFLGEVVD